MRFFSILFLTAWIPIAAGAQTISSEESMAVNGVARRFVQRLLETKDIAPVMHEMFAADAVDRMLDDGQNEWAMIVDREFASDLSRQQRKRFARAFFTWIHLANLYGSTVDAPATTPLFERLPESVRRIMLADPLVRFSIELRNADDVADDDASRIDTDAEFDLLLSTLEQTVSLLKAAMSRSGPRENARWMQFQGEQESLRGFYKPGAVSCVTDCFGAQPGTRIFYVNVPVFQLVMLKLNGRMVVTNVIPYL